MSKSEILKDRLASIRDQLNFLGIKSDFYPDKNRFTLNLKDSKRTQYGIMRVIERVRDIHYTDTYTGAKLVDIHLYPYADDSVDVTVVNIQPGFDYYLGFIENMVILIYHTSEVDINEYYKSVRNNINDGLDDTTPSHWNDGIPAKLERSNFLYHDKISELDHVKTTFICPNCFGRVSFNLKSESTFTISSDIEEFDIQRIRTTFEPICVKCDQIMFECDEDFVDRIIKLNLLGIVTEYCCSGHDDPIDRVYNGKMEEIKGYSFPYITINVAKTNPNILSIILTEAKALQNLDVMFMDKDPHLRIATKIPDSIDISDKITKEDQDWMRDILFKFVDTIIAHFDKEVK